MTAFLRIRSWAACSFHFCRERAPLRLRMAVDQNTPMAPQTSGDLNSYTWADKGLGYSLVGPTPQDRLHPLANEVRKQLSSKI